MLGRTIEFLLKRQVSFALSPSHPLFEVADYLLDQTDQPGQVAPFYQALAGLLVPRS